MRGDPSSRVMNSSISALLARRWSGVRRLDVIAFFSILISVCGLLTVPKRDESLIAGCAVYLAKVGIELGELLRRIRVAHVKAYDDDRHAFAESKHPHPKEDHCAHSMDSLSTRVVPSLASEAPSCELAVWCDTCNSPRREWHAYMNNGIEAKDPARECVLNPSKRDLHGTIVHWGLGSFSTAQRLRRIHLQAYDRDRSALRESNRARPEEPDCLHALGDLSTREVPLLDTAKTDISVWCDRCNSTRPEWCAFMEGGITPRGADVGISETIPHWKIGQFALAVPTQNAKDQDDEMKGAGPRP